MSHKMLCVAVLFCVGCEIEIEGPSGSNQDEGVGAMQNEGRDY